jgi:RNA polymerase sigma factor (sigma-70 family)
MTPLLAQRARTDRAFERLYRRHVGDVYRYALAVLRNPSDAEDVAQTTFLNAYRAFQRGERPRKPQNWLIRIAHNVCHQRFRQSARRPNEVAFDEDLAEAVARDSDVASAQDLALALSRLAFNQRSALVMRELEGRSYAEIAEALGLTVAAVETLLFRARRALREQLEGGLTCREAELAISRQIDDRLPRAELGALRAHLRECRECATFARSQRAQRAVWKGLAAIPLPSSLASFFGSGGGGAVGTGAATAGFGVAVKATALVGAAALAGGVGYEGVKRGPWSQKKTQTVTHKAVAPKPRPIVLISQASPTTSVTTRFAAKPEQKAEPSAKATKGTKLKVKRKTPPSQANKVAVVVAAPSAPKRRGKTMDLPRSERAKAKPVGQARTEARAKKAKQKMNTKQKATPTAPVERKADKDLGQKPEEKVRKKEVPAPPVPAPEEHGNEEHGNGSNGGGKK